MEDSESNKDSGLCEECDFCKIDDDDEIEFDREEFSKMLSKISVEDTRMFVRLSFLGNLAYSIPKIKPEKLLKYHKLRFVTSSIEKRMMNLKVEEKNNNDKEEEEENKKKMINPAVVQISSSFWILETWKGRSFSNGYC